MIRLYASNETDFTHNRYLLKDVINCEVNEVENEAFDLTIEYPINPDMQEEAVIKAPTPRGEQLFVIESITKTLKGYKAYAIDYISYKLKKNFLIDTRPTDMNCQESINYMLSNLVNPVLFTGTSDVKGVGTGYYVRKNGLEALIGADNSILNRFGGYLKRSGMNIHIAENPRDIGYEIRMGRNLLGVEQSIDMTEVITRLYPTVVLANDTVTSLPEQYIDSLYLNKYAQPMIKEVRIELTEDEKILALSQIHDIMRMKARQLFETGIDLPNVNYKIDFVQISKTTRLKTEANTGLSRYTHGQLSTFTHSELGLNIHGISFGDPTDILEKMNQLDISDQVAIYVPKLDIYVKARVIKYSYDAIGKKFKKIELGDYKPMEKYQTQNVILNMDRNLKLKANQTSIDTPTHVLTENGFTLKDNAGGLLMSKYGSINNDNFSSRDNVEEGYPLWIPFEIDDDVSKIKKVSLWWKNFPYRASAKNIAGGGGGVITTPSGGGKTAGPSSVSTTGAKSWGSVYVYTTRDVSVEDYHLHTVKMSEFDHEHDMTHNHVVPDHEHEFELEDHTHPLEFGIVETPITDDTFTIWIDGTECLTVNARTGKADITQWITEVGDHEIELRSTTKKLIHANVALKTYIKG